MDENCKKEIGKLREENRLLRIVLNNLSKDEIIDNILEYEASRERVRRGFQVNEKK